MLLIQIILFSKSLSSFAKNGCPYFPFSNPQLLMGSKKEKKEGNDLFDNPSNWSCQNFCFGAF